MKKEKEFVLNEKQSAILRVLKDAADPLSLAEISAAAGFEVKSGTTNNLVKRGYMEVVGERTIVCPTCGRKRTVKTYRAVTK